MGTLFAEILKKMRKEKELSQRELADMLYVTRSTVARWENGTRLPDAIMLAKLANFFGVDVGTLVNATAVSEKTLNIIIVDDMKIALKGGIPVLEEAFPYAVVKGFTRPSEAVEYAKENQVSLAFLDIELGTISGLDLCQKLLEINPHTNVVFLTAYASYAFDAWSTGASGFMLKPITREGIRAQLKNLRYPLFTEDPGE